MTGKNNLLISPVDQKVLLQRMLVGAGIGFLVISFFVFSVDSPRPEWGQFWRVRPLLLTPLVAAFGTLAFSANIVLRPQKTWQKGLLWVLSSLAFLFALWIGVVLGLDGTMWN